MESASKEATPAAGYLLPSLANFHHHQHGLNQMSERHFPPPWSVEELTSCFFVRDANGQRLGYFYFEEEPGRRSAAKLLTRDEAAMAAQA
jgi:hypothetical protein